MALTKASEIAEDIGWSLNRTKVFVRKNNIAYQTSRTPGGEGDYLLKRAEFDHALEGSIRSVKGWKAHREKKKKAAGKK